MRSLPLSKRRLVYRAQPYDRVASRKQAGSASRRQQSPLRPGPPSSVVEHFLGKEEVTGSSPVVGGKRGEGALVRGFWVVRPEPLAVGAPSTPGVQVWLEHSRVPFRRFRKMAKREIQPKQAARERWNDRSHRSRQDDVDGGTCEGAVEEGSRESDLVRRHREGRHGSRRDEDGDDRGFARGVRE